MKKRILPLLLALALCTSLMTPALAAETVTLTKESDSEAFPGTYQLKLSGVLAQENVSWTEKARTEFTNDQWQWEERTHHEQDTIYTVSPDFTAVGTHARDGIINDQSAWFSLTERGYRLLQDGTYEAIGSNTSGEGYWLYTCSETTGEKTSQEVTKEEFRSKCDILEFSAIDFLNSVTIRIDGHTTDVPVAPTIPTVSPSPCKGTLDGMMLTMNAYLFQENGGGSNYVMLRDVAQLLNGTKAQFEVDWDKDKGIILTTGQAYTTMGGELQSKGDGDKPYTANASTITVDGKAVELAAYTIEGNNYFKLRDLGAALNFNVSWDSTNGIGIDSTQPYSGAN